MKLGRAVARLKIYGGGGGICPPCLTLARALLGKVLIGVRYGKVRFH